MAANDRLEILLLAYHFPPLAGMASNRAVRFVNELTERDHQVTVVTGNGDPPLEGPCMELHDGVRIVRAGKRQLSGGVRAARSALSASAGGATAPEEKPGVRHARLRQWVRDWVYVPDAQIAWFGSARRAVRTELAKMRNPVLWTTSVPFTGHLVGAAVRKGADVRWVAEFRDPWVHSQDAALRAPRRIALDRRMEANIIRRPDALIFTTDATRDLFATDHGDWIRDRSHVVTNTWRREDFVEPMSPPADQPLRLVYAGSLNLVQDPLPLIEAISRINRSNAGMIELHVYGPRNGWPSGDVHHHGPVPPIDVPNRLAEASVLVMLAPGRDYRPILLGKTMDWLGSAQPCLGILDAEGAMVELIEESHGGVVCRHNRLADIEECLHVLLDAHRSGRLDRFRPDPLVADRFELQAVSNLLEHALGAKD